MTVVGDPLSVSLGALVSMVSEAREKASLAVDPTWQSADPWSAAVDWPSILAKRQRSCSA